MSKYLIINADDFGYNPQQTKAIDELMRGKLITSTSLMTSRRMPPMPLNSQGSAAIPSACI